MTDRKEGYDLRAAVLEVLDANPGMDLGVVATKVAADVPPRELRSVLATLMHGYVEDVNRLRRAQNALLNGEREAARIRSARSSKVGSIRDWSERWLADLVKIDGTDKMLGDCTYDDLMWVADLRRKQARELAAKASDYQRIADKVQECGVETVRDLPASALRDLTGGAAA